MGDRPPLVDANAAGFRVPTTVPPTRPDDIGPADAPGLHLEDYGPGNQFNSASDARDPASAAIAA